MKTTNGVTAGIFQLVCVSVIFGASMAKSENYDAVLLRYNLSFVQPDPLNPFPVGGSNLYITDPNQLNTTDTTVFVSMQWGFKERTSGEWVSIKQPNLFYSTLGLTGKYEEKGVVNTISNDNMSLAGSVYTDINSPDPNPTTGGAWIYGTVPGASGEDVITTPTGRVIRDPNGVPLNGGAYTVDSDPDLRVAKYSVVGAKMKLTTMFINQVSNLRFFAQNYEAKHNIFIVVTDGMTVHSALSSTEGCMSRTQYPAHFRPRIYCGNERGPVTLGLTIESPTTLRIQNGGLSDLLIQRSADLLTWEPASVPVIDNLVNGDTRLTFAVPNPIGTTHLPDGPRCYYRLAVPGL